MQDPLKRWRSYRERPFYAGLLSFGDVPYAEDADELEGVDVAIVGVPMDDLTSERPGARLGPRAIRAAGRTSGRHRDAGVDAFQVLKIVDFGDAPVVPGNPLASHAAARDLVGKVAEVGAIPIVLGGDHSITEPNVIATGGSRPLGLVHFDAHADTLPEVFGSELSHGTVMYRLIESGAVAAGRYVQIGGRGYSPTQEVLEWQRKKGVRSFTMADVSSRGIRAVVEDALAGVGDGPAFLTIDVDVLDPAFAPGTGSPEPGGMSSSDLLWAVRRTAEAVELAGVDVVEVMPLSFPGSDITALVADRLVREVLTGLAIRRLASSSADDG